MSVLLVWAASAVSWTGTAVSDYSLLQVEREQATFSVCRERPRGGGQFLRMPALTGGLVRHLEATHTYVGSPALAMRFSDMGKETHSRCLCVCVHLGVGM